MLGECNKEEMAFVYANESMYLFEFVSISVIHSPFATSSWNDILYYLPELLSVQEPTLHDGSTYLVPCLQRSSCISPFCQPQIHLQSVPFD